MAAVIKIEIVTTGGVDQVKKDVESLGSSAKSAGSGFSAMGEIATGALRAIGEMAVNLAGAALSKIGDVLSDSISAAKESNMVAAQTAQVIKSTGEAAGVTTQHVLDYASSLSAASGKSLFGDEQIAQSTNLLLTFTNIKKTTLDAATAISVDMAQALGGAPKDAAIQLGKALNDPVKGITALTRVGVTFTKEQKATIQAMQEAGNTAGAQKIILAELNKEFGGSAAAAAKADGGWAQFHDRLGEVEETIGKAILPLLGSLVGIVNDNLLPVIESAAAAFGPFIQDLMQAFSEGGLGGAINTVLNELLGLNTNIGFLVDDKLTALKTLIDDVAQGFSEGGLGGAINTFLNEVFALNTTIGFLVDDAFVKLKTDFTDAQTPVQGFVNVLSDVSPTFAAVYAIVQDVMPEIQTTVTTALQVVSDFWAANGADIMATVQTTWATIKQIIAVALPLIEAIIKGVLATITGFIRDHGAAIQQALTDTWGIIKNVIGAALAFIQGILTAALAVMHGDWAGAWQAIQQMSVTVTLALGQAIKSFLDLIASYFGTSLKGIGDLWAHNWDEIKKYVANIDWKKLGVDIINGIIAGISGSTSKLADAARSAANDAYHAAAKALGIESPSTVMAQGVGVPIITGIAAGLKQALPGLIQLIDQIGSDIVAANKKWTLATKQAFQNAFTDIDNQVEKLGDSISNTIADAFTGAASLDRAKASAISALQDISAAQQQAVQQQLAAADAAASAMSDPTQAAQFFKMRTDQIFEIAKLQDQVNAATDDTAKKQLMDQIALIQDAQSLEIQGAQKAAQSPTAALLDQLSQLQQKADSLFHGAGNQGLPGMLDGNATINAITALTNQLQQMTSGGNNTTTNASNSVFNYQQTITTSAPVPVANPVHVRAMAGV